MTKEEITSLIKFAKELDNRAAALRLSQAELSRRTALGGAEPISQGYISDILRVGRGDSKKYFRLQRDKVIRLAQAVEWDLDEALDYAGFKSVRGESEAPRDDRSAEAARTVEMIENWTEMTPEEQERALQFFKFLKTERPKGFARLNPNFKIMTDEEFDQEFDENQPDVKIEKPKSK